MNMEAPMMAPRFHDVDLELEKTIQELRDRQIRITPQRRAILRYLISTDTHPTVEEIYRNICQDSGKDMSLATVYNNLNTLVDAGIVYEMKFSDVTSRYDYRGQGHRHILCTNCGKIADFYAPELDIVKQAAEQQTAYKVDALKMELYGLCPDCQKLLDTH